jgi:hypothetical protein
MHRPGKQSLNLSTKVRKSIKWYKSGIAFSSFPQTRVGQVADLNALG